MVGLTASGACLAAHRHAKCLDCRRLKFAQTTWPLMLFGKRRRLIGFAAGKSHRIAEGPMHIDDNFGEKEESCPTRKLEKTAFGPSNIVSQSPAGKGGKPLDFVKK